MGSFLKSDERILGDSDFVESVLGAAEEQLERESLYHSEGVDFDQVVQRVAELLHLTTAEVLQYGKKPMAVLARSLLCYWATREVGISATELAIRLGLSQSAVSRSALRGEHRAVDKGWQIR